MNKLYKFVAVLAVPAILMLYSYSGGSPGGKTGSIGDNGNTCTDCHTGTASGQVGWITSNIPDEGYTPGVTYTITATGTHEGVVKFGFELTAEDNAGAKLGGLFITDAARTKFTNSNNAITHTQAGNVPAGDMNTWSMNWTAPADIEDGIWFYAAFNAANGNGGTGGDQIYTSSLTVTEFVPIPIIASVDPDNAEQGWTGELTIFGENTNWSSGVFAVVFKYSEDPSVKFQATNIQVEDDTKLTCDIAIPEDQDIGSYNVSVNSATLNDGFTVDVASGLGDDLLAESTMVYPNPVREFAHIELPAGSNVSVIDVRGRELISLENTSKTESVDFTEFENGIYFMRISHDGNIAVKKIIKQ